MSSLLEIEAMLDAKMAQLRSEQRLLESEIAECHRDKSNKRSIQPLSSNHNNNNDDEKRNSARLKRSQVTSHLNVHSTTKAQREELSRLNKKETEENSKEDEEENDEEENESEEDGIRRKMTLKQRLQELEMMRKKYAARANKSMNDYLRNVSNYENYQEERRSKLANAKPFSFEMREKVKPLRICEIRQQNETEERRKAEAEACQTQFTAKPVPATTFMNKYDLMVEEWAERKAAIESLARAKADIMKDEEAELAHSNAILKHAREEIRGRHSYYDDNNKQTITTTMTNSNSRREFSFPQRLLTRAQSADGRLGHKRNGNLSNDASYKTQPTNKQCVKKVNNHDSMLIDASIPLEVRLRLWPALKEYENVRQERIKAKAAQMKTNIDTEFSQSMPLMNSVAESKTNSSKNNNTSHSSCTHRLPNFMIDYKTFLSAEDNMDMSHNNNTTLSGQVASHPVLGIGQPISMVTVPPAPLPSHTTTNSSSPFVMLPRNTHITTPLPPPTQVALAPLSSPLTYSPRNNTDPLTTDNKVYGIGSTLSTTVVIPSTAATTSINNNNVISSTTNTNPNIIATVETKQASLLAPATVIDTKEAIPNVVSVHDGLKPTQSVSERRRVMRRSNSAFSFHPRIRPGVPNFKELWAQEEATRHARKAAILQKLQQTTSSSSSPTAAAEKSDKEKQNDKQQKEKKKEIIKKKQITKKLTSDLKESLSTTPMTSDINKIPKGTRAHALRTQAIYANYLHSAKINVEKEESNNIKDGINKEGDEVKETSEKTSKNDAIDEKRKAHQREVRERLKDYLQSTKTSQREQEERIAMKVKELKARERESAQAARMRLKEMYERVNQMPPLFVAEPMTRLHTQDQQKEELTEPSARDAAEQEVIALLTESGLQQEHLQQLLADPTQVAAKDNVCRTENADITNNSNISAPADSAVQRALRVVSEALDEIEQRQEVSNTINNNNINSSDGNTAVNLSGSAEEKSKIVEEEQGQPEKNENVKDATFVIDNNETTTNTKKKERSSSSSSSRSGSSLESSSSSSTSSSTSSSSSAQLHPLTTEQSKMKTVETKNDDDHDNVDKHSEYDDSFESSSSSSSSSSSASA